MVVLQVKEALPQSRTIVQLPPGGKTHQRYSGVPLQLAFPVKVTDVPTACGEGGLALIVTDVQLAVGARMCADTAAQMVTVAAASRRQATLA